MPSVVNGTMDSCSKSTDVSDRKLVFVMRVNNVIVESRNAKLTTRMSDEFYGNGAMRSSIGIVKYFECFYNFISKIGDITNLR